MLLRIRWVAVALALITCGSGLKPTHATAQYEQSWHCRVFATFENTDRYVISAPEVEDWPHTVPWSNWGVDSNLGPRYDGHQFDGWHSSGGWYEWNSSSDDHPNPNCAYYNANACYDQESATGPNQYATVLMGDWWVDEPQGDAAGGCLQIEGLTFGATENFMKIYDLDPYDWDDYVGALQFPNLTATLDCDDPFYCNGASQWTSYSGRVGHPLEASIRMRLWTDLSFY